MSPSHSSRPAGRRIGIAIAGAVCLHLGLLALLWLLPKPRKPERQRPMEVTLLETPRPTEQQAPPPLPEPPQRATRDRPQRRPQAQIAQEQARQGTAEHAPQSVPPPAQSRPWTRDWQLAEGLQHEGPPPGGIRLDLDHPAAQLGAGRHEPAPAPLGPVRVPTREEALAAEHDRVEARVGGWLSESKARERAGPGRDVTWQSLEDALGKGFSPGWDVVDEGPVSQQPSVLRDVLQAWQKRAEAYGKSGNPFANQSDGPGAQHALPRDLPVLANEDRGLGGRSLEGFGGWWLGAGIGGGGNGQDSGFSQRLVSLIRVTQREDGSIAAIELAGSSGNLVYDKVVLKKAYALKSLHLAPPKQGLESLWAFETRFTRVPPMPIAGCALDETFLPKDCWYPLQKRTESHVHLQAIY